MLTRFPPATDDVAAADYRETVPAARDLGFRAPAQVGAESPGHLHAECWPPTRRTAQGQSTNRQDERRERGVGTLQRSGELTRVNFFYEIFD